MQSFWSIRRLALVSACIAAFALSTAGVDALGRRQQPGQVPPAAGAPNAPANPISLAELNRLFEAYAVVQAQDFLNRNGQLSVSGGDFDQISSFAVDGSGRLYVIGLDGDIHRLTPGATAGDGLDYLRGEDGNDRR